jgi:hypothetical protein
MRIGLTNPTHKGEVDATAFGRLFSAFPHANSARVFRTPTQDLPSWTSPLMRAVPLNAEILISFKKPTILNGPFATWAAAMPNDRKEAGGIIRAAYHHEPDNWKSASDTKGDPDPTTWRQRYVSWLNSAANQPWREWTQLGAIFTEYVFRIDREFWDRNWGANVSSNRVIDHPQLDWLGVDCYNLGPLRYRPDGEMFEQFLTMAAQFCKPVVVAEWGHVRRTGPPDNDSDGSKCAAVMWSHYEYCRTQRIAPVITMNWWYNSDNDLDNRQPERDALRSIAEQAVIDEQTTDPDPHDPQYQHGYNAGYDDGYEAGKVEGNNVGRKAVLDALDKWSAQQRG